MVDKFKLSVLGAAVALTFTAATAAVAAPRSYIVVGAGNALPANLEARITAAGGKLTRTLPGIGLAVVSSDRPGFVGAAKRIAGVQSVATNVVRQWQPREPLRVSLDENFGYPPFSGDNDTRFDLQWGHTAVDAVGAWNLGYRGAGATVAVLDGGFDLDHPDLAPNIDFAKSANFVAGETLSYALPDPFSHGTHVAGTIAAADNGIGTIGVAPAARLALVKVLNDGGSGSFADIISGIYHAATVGGVDVINMSLGAALPRNGFVDDNGTPDPTDDVKVGANEVAELLNAVGRATTFAYQNGIAVIAAAGNDANDGNKDKALVFTPADAPHVISISATAPIGWAIDPTSMFLDNLASYSNYGASAIDFAAPGGDAAYPGNENCTIGGLLRPCWVFDLVFSTGSNLNPAIASYYWSAGTSMAAPHAAGVAAIIIGKNGGSMHPAQVEAALRASAEDLGKPGNDFAYGAGRVNAARAVR